MVIIEYFFLRFFHGKYNFSNIIFRQYCKIFEKKVKNFKISCSIGNDKFNFLALCHPYRIEGFVPSFFKMSFWQNPAIHAAE